MSPDTPRRLKDRTLDSDGSEGSQEIQGVRFCDANTKRRIVSYDVFRGFLLVAMVCFHVLANLTDLVFDQRIFYWVPMGFIFFLGIVLSAFLKNKKKKKFFLGAKLFGVFIFLNVHHFVQNELSFGMLLMGDTLKTSFEILFPMSLMIFLSLFFDQFSRQWKILFALAFFSLVLLNGLHFYSYNLCFLIYGLLGYFLGFGVDLDEMTKRWMNLKSIFVAIGVCYAVFFSIYFLDFRDFFVLFQMLAFYFLSTALFKNSDFLCFLGRNSFSFYIGHIFLIKLLTLL